MTTDHPPFKTMTERSFAATGGSDGKEPALRKRLGLSAGASDAEVNAKLLQAIDELIDRLEKV